MEDPLLSLLKLAAILALMLVNAFFVAAEFALVSIRRTRVEELIREGNPTARVIKNALNAPERFIAATQLGITMASLGVGWIAEPAVAHLIESLFGFLPPAITDLALHSFAAGAIAFILVTFFTVVIGELTPKSIALTYLEKTALIATPPTLLFEGLFRPVIWALAALGVARVRKWKKRLSCAGHSWWRTWAPLQSMSLSPTWTGVRVTAPST